MTSEPAALCLIVCGTISNRTISPVGELCGDLVEVVARMPLFIKGPCLGHYGNGPGGWTKRSSINHCLFIPDL
ncbi:hypothetical protein CEXT_17961 [Caerostris extrusa]|uniref:Secreted protein n=1 Tax=Caerostris extrusa TaxID=172846 RepID=A0AAV4SGC5_CAEEX|nr:hypothetical protein CEXT_17961 [Caerostris extrusa]